MKPLAIDLYAGLGGWAEGFLAEGYDVIGFDIERHDYGTGEYLGQLVLQDVTTLNGSQFRNATCIVASPPCQEYSYMSMPWTRAKQMIAEYLSGTRDVKKLTQLFDACFQIQREACEAAGRHVPMVVENVKGAQPWVGRAKWHYGSFYLWGDVPALMPFTFNGQKLPNRHDTWRKTGKPCRHFTNPSEGSEPADHLKFGGGWWHDSTNNLIRKASSRSPARKRASAMIAKIPFPLSSHIARCFKPEDSHDC